MWQLELFIPFDILKPESKPGQICSLHFDLPLQVSISSTRGQQSAFSAVGVHWSLMTISVQGHLCTQKSITSLFRQYRAVYSNCWSPHNFLFHSEDVVTSALQQSFFIYSSIVRLIVGPSAGSRTHIQDAGFCICCQSKLVKFALQTVKI